MAWGGRYLYRLLVRERGMDPQRIIVTDLDADYRVHPQYFAYLSWVHLTDPEPRDAALPADPVLPQQHLAGADAPAPLRGGPDPAPDVAQRPAREAPELRLLLDHAAPRPRRRLLGHRCDPRGQPLLLEELLPLRRPVPGRAALHPDLRRRGPRARLLAQHGRAVPPGPSLGMGRDRHPVRHRERDRATPRSRSGRASGASPTCSASTSTGRSRRSWSCSAPPCRCSSTRRSPRRRSARTCRSSRA